MKIVTAIRLTEEEKQALERVIKMFDSLTEAEESLLDECMWDNDSPHIQDAKSSLQSLLSLNRKN